ncbi:MAG: hypothetical protein RMI94_08840 [Bryobacterales bacterium]|nr:hypothetical protein [Bryobacterales bacterium]
MREVTAMRFSCLKVAAIVASTLSCAPLFASEAVPPAGAVPILKVAEIRPGMKGTAWTAFRGSTPEPIPVEIIGLWRNAWGPGQDVILARMGGEAARTNVAGGMSGSPVYVDGRLVGAVSLRLSVFSPDAICGITPIELMLEIGEFESGVPADLRAPGTSVASLPLPLPPELLAGALRPTAVTASSAAALTPIRTPLNFAGFDPAVLREFAPAFEPLGVGPVQGGAAGTGFGPRPAPGWERALRPGEPVAAVLVTGDMSVSGLGTVTYNDGRRVLAFGHSFFNLGPVDMPMARAEVLFTHASAFQPNKFANAAEIVGALRQDRHSGLLGVLGAEARMVPVSLTVRSLGEGRQVRRERTFRFHVFVHQRWTPYLMMVTLFNSVSSLNEFMEESTFRLSGKVELEGQPNLELNTMQAPGELPVPAPMLLAGWWGDKFNRLFLNAVKTPRLKSVNALVELLPERRVATIEGAWIPANEVEPGDEVPVRVFLRLYRGARIEREFKIRIPPGLARGEHRILLSDADTINRIETSAGFMNRFIDLPQAVSLINRERSNNCLYVSLVQARPTFFYDDKTLPSLPGSAANLMQTARAAARALPSSAESAVEQTVIPFDFIVNGSHALKIQVR